jgi:hypothetical protein
MIQRRARTAGIKTRIGNYTFRATGITTYLRNEGKLEHAQTMANHSSPRTTKLHDRREEEISLDEVELVTISTREEPAKLFFARAETMAVRDALIL